jgi:phosphatidylglycerophosphate synthase
VFDEVVRRRLAPALAPAARRLGGWGITPNHVTIATFVIAAAGAALTAAGLIGAGLVLWLTSRVGDGLDGVIARETAQSTARGGYLDITLDMAAYSLMVVAFAVIRPELGLVWPMILMGYVLAITTTLALAAAAERAHRTVSGTDRTFQFTPALAEAGETTVVYVLWYLFPAYVGPIAWIWCGVLILSAVQRSILAWRWLR